MIRFVLSLFGTERIFVYLTVAAGLILVLALAEPRVGVPEAQHARTKAISARRDEATRESNPAG